MAVGHAEGMSAALKKSHKIFQKKTSIIEIAFLPIKCLLGPLDISNSLCSGVPQVFRIYVSILTPVSFSTFFSVT